MPSSDTRHAALARLIASPGRAPSWFVAGIFCSRPRDAAVNDTLAAQPNEARDPTARGVTQAGRQLVGYVYDRLHRANALVVGLYMYKIRKAAVEASATRRGSGRHRGGNWIPVRRWNPTFNCRHQTILAICAYGYRLGVAGVAAASRVICRALSGHCTGAVGGRGDRNPELKAPMVNEHFASGGPYFNARSFPSASSASCAISRAFTPWSLGTTPKMT